FVASTLLAWCPSSFALNPTLPVTESGHTVWKRGDAFSSGIVEAIAQTPDGHFWLGSSTGLIRFDGAAKSPSMVRLRRSLLGANARPTFTDCARHGLSDRKCEQQRAGHRSGAGHMRCVVCLSVCRGKSKPGWSQNCSTYSPTLQTNVAICGIEADKRIVVRLRLESRHSSDSRYSTSS